MYSVCVVEKFSQWSDSIADKLIRLFPILLIEDLSQVDDLPLGFKRKSCLILSASVALEAPNYQDLARDFAHFFVVGKDLGNLTRELQDAFTQNKSEQFVQYQDLTFNLSKFWVRVGTDTTNPTVELSLKEAQILKAFLDHPRQCLSRRALQEMVWSNAAVSPRTIDSHVSRLRKKLASSVVSIENHYGLGYILA